MKERGKASWNVDVRENDESWVEDEPGDNPDGHEEEKERLRQRHPL